MSTTSAKDKLNEAGSYTKSAAEDLKTSAERNAKDLLSKAEANAKDLRSKAEANANSLKSQAESWKNSAEADAKSFGKSAEKETRWFGKSAEKNAKSWASTAEGKASSLKDEAEAKAQSLKNQAESGWNSLSKEAKDSTSSMKTSAQDTASSVKSSAEKSAKDVKNYIAGTSITDPNAWVPQYSVPDYLRFFSAGALCATITHGAMTPVDVVKTRLQLEPKGSKLNMLSMARGIVASEGASGLMTGFGPTAVGYLIQGGSKFCGFEFFKQKFATMAGSRQVAENNRTLIYMGAASSAELIASTLLTPLEAARIRLVSSRSYANGLVGAVSRMAREGGLREFYAGAYTRLYAQRGERESFDRIVLKKQHHLS